MAFAPGTVHEAATFAGLDLRGHTLERVDLVDCTLTDCLLSESKLERCSFEDVTFRGCDLGLVALGDSALRGARFVECKLTGIDWSHAHPLTFEVSFEDCVLDLCSFVGLRLRKLRIEGGRAHDVGFADSDLRDAVFEHVDLAGASFERNDLRGADLSTCANLVLRPDANRLRDTRLPLDAALAHLAELGIVVPG